MAFLNMYRKVSLPSVAESQSSWIFLAIDLFVGPELGLELGLLPSVIHNKFDSFNYTSLISNSNTKNIFNNTQPHIEHQEM